MKWFGFRIGYTKGMDIINSGSGDEVIKRISGAATVLGLCVAGCLVSTTVKLSVPLELPVVMARLSFRNSLTRSCLVSYQY